jgi:hypothetical protein
MASLTVLAIQFLASVQLRLPDLKRTHRSALDPSRVGTIPSTAKILLSYTDRICQPWGMTKNALRKVRAGGSGKVTPRRASSRANPRGSAVCREGHGSTKTRFRVIFARGPAGAEGDD